MQHCLLCLSLSKGRYLGFSLFLCKGRYLAFVVLSFTTDDHFLFPVGLQFYLSPVILLCLFLGSDSWNRESGVAVVQGYVTINKHRTDIPSDIDICLFLKSCGDGGVVTRVGLTSWEHVAMILHVGDIGLILTSFFTSFLRQVCIRWSLMWLSSLFRTALLTQTLGGD